jgi:hypothetical protein
VSLYATLDRGKSKPIGVDDYMPFGKHKGMIVKDVPPDYLRWALKSADLCNPDHDRYWPELRETFEGLVGPHAPVRPACLPIAVFCARLRAEGITLAIRDSELVASEELTGELLESLKAHANLIGAVLLIGQDTRTIATGAARAGQAAELKGLVKRWYNAMSQRFHPDAGGRDEHQVAINAGFNSLKEMIAKWETNP